MMPDPIVTSSARRRIAMHLFGRKYLASATPTTGSSCGMQYLHSSSLASRMSNGLGSESTCGSYSNVCSQQAKNRRYFSTLGNDGKDAGRNSKGTITKPSLGNDVNSGYKLNNETAIHSAKTTTSATEVFDRIVYVHPLSQIVLEYLQNHWSDWLVEHGLDRSLTIHRDGTFELVFMSDLDTIATAKQARYNPWTSLDAYKIENRIWTSYEEEEKKHWISIRKHKMRQKFLLQDNLAGTGTWHGRDGDSNTTQQRVHKAVNELIQVVDQQQRVDVLRSQQDEYLRKK